MWGVTPFDGCRTNEVKGLLTRNRSPGSLQAACLSVTRDKVKKTTGLPGFENLPLPFIIKRKLKLEDQPF